MSIDVLNKNQLFTNPEFPISRLSGADSFDFELELPEAASFAQLMESGEVEDILKMQQIKLPIDEVDSSMLKNLKYLALKDQIPFKLKDIKDIRLMIYAHDLMGNNDKFKINLDSLDNKDINFLRQLMDNPNAIINSVNGQNLQVNLSADQSAQVSYLSFNVSKGLSDLIEYAYKSQKPVRLDFEGNSSIILRINNEGKLSAEFMSSNKAMEYILKNSIPHLRNRLDSEGIPYKEVVYRDRNKKQNQQEQERS
ncbi:MAG: hypothetical protein ACD_20C00122G0014 [uncultured bacterium]|nr:MAG: hypothetical protein ACD_20C00122G0014 [uncultured bacterium]HBH18960.1 hypothetical protein [Cyanobacteria bacterium UBA9579]